MPCFSPHPYQHTAINFLACRYLIDDEEGAGLFLDPGLGKTGITLSVLHQLKMARLIRRTLIVAPLRAIYMTWPDEIVRWRFPFSWQTLHGSPKTRANKLLAPADLYLINPEGLPWLEKQYRSRFDFMVVDESTKFKSWSAARTKAIRKLVPRCNRRLILTGTPAPNGYIDLHSQQFVVDKGAALGPTVTQFRNEYCIAAGYLGQGFQVPKHREPAIENAIAPSVLTMRAEDHLDMPRKLDHIIEVELPPAIRKAYNDIERGLFAELDNGSTLMAMSAGGKYSLCKQIAGGGAYETDPITGEREAVHVHNAKAEALADLVDELGGKPLLCAYQFNHDAERLLKVFPGTPVVRGGMSPSKTTEILRDWNAGKLKLLLVQPQALSHSANLQFGGSDLCWYGHTDQLEIFLQFNARLWRQGQTSGQVRLHHIIARDTVDEAVYERLKNKDAKQLALLNSLKDYRERRTSGHSQPH